MVDMKNVLLTRMKLHASHERHFVSHHKRINLTRIKYDIILQLSSYLPIMVTLEINYSGRHLADKKQDVPY